MSKRIYTVAIKLPGKSPRELVCHPSCILHSFSVAGDVTHGWQAHSEYCPVHELRNDFADYFDSDAALLRAAFCEPEPTT